MIDPAPNAGQTLIIVLPSILAFLTSALAAVLAYLAGRRSAVVATKIEDLHVIVNSRLDQLLSTTRASSRAEGVVAGTLVERQRVASLAPDTGPDRQAGGYPQAK